MLELIDVHTYYGESYILHGISLNVGRGSIAALLGPNGMGKTTTVRSIIGFTPPRSGIIQFKGSRVESLPSYKICQMGMALVPQGRRIFPSLSVEENMVIGARGNRWSLEKAYSFFPRLKERAKHKGNLLSGGEQQMLCIARALLTDPDFLLMDEPSEGLAPLLVEEIGDIITQLKADGLSVLLVEQNLPLALSVSDYVYIMNKGLIVYQSVAEELSSNEEAKTKYLGALGE
jgi:branched-chain amino acid transport system ATP-binding protein